MLSEGRCTTRICIVYQSLCTSIKTCSNKLKILVTVILYFCLILATINEFIMPGTFRCAANIFRCRKKELVCTIKIVLYTVKNFLFTSTNIYLILDTRALNASIALAATISGGRAFHSRMLRGKKDPLQ